MSALYASTGEEPEKAMIIAPVAIARATAKIGIRNKRKLLIRETNHSQIISLSAIPAHIRFTTMVSFLPSCIGFLFTCTFRHNGRLPH